MIQTAFAMRYPKAYNIFVFFFPWTNWTGACPIRTTESACVLCVWFSCVHGSLLIRNGCQCVRVVVVIVLTDHRARGYVKAIRILEASDQGIKFLHREVLDAMDLTSWLKTSFLTTAPTGTQSCGFAFFVIPYPFLESYTALPRCVTFAIWLYFMWKLLSLLQRSNRGIIPRSVEKIFEEIERMKVRCRVMAGNMYPVTIIACWVSHCHTCSKMFSIVIDHL